MLLYHGRPLSSHRPKWILITPLGKRISGGCALSLLNSSTVRDNILRTRNVTNYTFFFYFIIVTVILYCLVLLAECRSKHASTAVQIYIRLYGDYTIIIIIVVKHILLVIIRLSLRFLRVRTIISVARTKKRPGSWCRTYIECSFRRLGGYFHRDNLVSGDSLLAHTSGRD